MGNVSRCCGCSYEDSFISDCCNVEMYRCNKFTVVVPSSRADNLTIEDFDNKCPSCNKKTKCSGYVCNQCDNWFEEPEEENEYEARMEENTMEEKADARRKYEE